MIERIEQRLEKSTLKDRDDIIRVVVEDEKGRSAIAFLSARLANGRVKFTLTTKKNKSEGMVHSTADWML
jgi:hypothetical protein